jgi:hypothetical protein
MKRLLQTGSMPCALDNWTVLIQQAIQYQQVIFGFMAAFFLQAINTGCALNGCEVSTLKKKNE